MNPHKLRRIDFANFRPPVKTVEITRDTVQRPVQRPDPVQKTESRLPVFFKAREILAAIQENDVLVLSGDTGCGKTSGLPQILMRNAVRKSLHRLPRIVVTQPRRVAATSVAARVASQIEKDMAIVKPLMATKKVNFSLGGLVGYRVRFEDRSSPESKITFVTDGLLIRECLMRAVECQDAVSPAKALGRYDYIIIDEAHERSLRIDQLMGLCKLALQEDHKPFKLIIMSATLDLKTLINFFHHDKIKVGHIGIEGRMFPVSVFYTPAPVTDIVEASVCAVTQIMVSDKTEGDVLVFLPGSDEIMGAKKLIEEKIASLKEFKNMLASIQRICSAYETNDEVKASIKAAKNVEEFSKFISTYFGVNLDVVSQEDQKRLMEALSQQGKVSFEIQSSVAGSPCTSDDEQSWLNDEFEVYPLFASLSFEEQKRIFLPPKSPRHRKIILSTNIAETSLTLPLVQHVIDTGVVKQKIGQSLKVVPASQAMIKQRAGRAGRVAAGTAYRLMTEADYSLLPVQLDPEMCRCDLAELVLEMKSWDGEKRVMTRLVGGETDKPLMLSQFPLPTPPPDLAVRDAAVLLKKIGAINGAQELLTDRGQKLCTLPLPVIWGNFLLEALELQCETEAMSIVAMMSMDTVWFPVIDKVDDRKLMFRRRILHPRSDHLGLLNLFNAYQRATNKRQFCDLVGVDSKNFERAEQIRTQLKEVLQTSFKLNTFRSVLAFAEDQKAIDLGHSTVLKALAEGLFMNIATREEGDDSVNTLGAVYVSADGKRLQIHPASAFFLYQSSRPDYILYSAAVETSALFARDVSALDADLVLTVLAKH